MSLWEIHDSQPFRVNVATWPESAKFFIKDAKLDRYTQVEIKHGRQRKILARQNLGMLSVVMFF